MSGPFAVAWMLNGLTYTCPQRPQPQVAQQNHNSVYGTQQPDGEKDSLDEWDHSSYQSKMNRREF